MRTQEEKDRQIDGLRRLRESLPLYNNFGQSNHAPINAQIAVIEGSSTPDDFYVDETAEEYEDGDNDVYSEAELAQQWLEGKSNEDLFQG